MGFNIVSDPVSAGVSLLGGLVSQHGQKSANRQTIEMNRENNRFNAEQAKLNRSSGSVMNQVYQMKASGINPAATGMNSVGQVSSAASSGASPVLHPEDALGRSLNDLALQQSQLALAKANERKINADAKNAEDSNEGIKSTNKILASDASFRDALNQGSLNLQASNCSLNLSLVDKNNQEISRLKELTPVEITKLRAETSSFLQGINESQQRISNMLDEMQTNSVYRKKLVADIQSVYKDIIIKQKEALLKDKEIAKAGKEIEVLDRTIKSLDVQYKRDCISLSTDYIAAEIYRNESDLKIKEIEFGKTRLENQKEWNNWTQGAEIVSQIISPILETINAVTGGYRNIEEGKAAIENSRTNWRDVTGKNQLRLEKIRSSRLKMRKYE